MDKQAKRAFIRDLCTAIRNKLLDSVERMPEEWDGHEIRQLITDTTREGAGTTSVMAPRTRRRRDYINTVVTRNL